MASATSRHCSPRNTEPSDYLTLDPTSQHVGWPNRPTARCWPNNLLVTWWLLICSLIYPAHGGSAPGTPPSTSSHFMAPDHDFMAPQFRSGTLYSLWDAAVCHPGYEIPYNLPHRASSPIGSFLTLDWTSLWTTRRPLSLHALEPAFCHPTFWTHPCHYAPHTALSCLARFPLHSADSRDIGSGMARPSERTPQVQPPRTVVRFGEALHPGPSLCIGTTRAGPMARPSTWRIFLLAFGILVRHISQQRTPEHLTSSSSPKPANNTAAYGPFMEPLPLSAPAPR